MKSKLRTIIDLVEAGEIELAQDFIEDAREELYQLVEGSEQEAKSYGDAAMKAVYAIDDMVHATDDPAAVTGSIIIVECESIDRSGRGLRYFTSGNFNTPYNRVGAMQYMTSAMMNESLGS